MVQSAEIASIVKKLVEVFLEFSKWLSENFADPISLQILLHIF